MELYNKWLDFPKRVHSQIFTLCTSILYLIFCLDPVEIFADKSYHFTLFFNNFNESGYMAWFVGAIYQYVFAFITYRAACSYINHKLIKSVFYALMVDALISLLNVIIFGCYNSVETILIRNVFVVLAMLYAYLVLPHES